MKPALLPEDWSFAEERYSETMKRYSGFGKDLFSKLEARFPGSISDIRFFRPQVYQTDDVWALYENGSTEFAIQLDPSCEVIVLWNEKKGSHIEIGTWSGDAYEEALKDIEKYFFNAENVAP